MKHLGAQNLLVMCLLMGISHYALGGGSQEREELEYCQSRVSNLKCTLNNLQSKFDDLEDEHEKVIERNELLEHNLSAYAQETVVLKKEALDGQQALEQSLSITLQQEQRIKELENIMMLAVQEQTMCQQHTEQLEILHQQQEQRIKELESNILNLTQEISRLSEQHMHDMQARIIAEKERNALPTDVKNTQSPTQIKEMPTPVEGQELALPPTSGN